MSYVSTPLEETTLGNHGTGLEPQPLATAEGLSRERLAVERRGGHHVGVVDDAFEAMPTSKWHRLLRRQFGKQMQHLSGASIALHDADGKHFFGSRPTSTNEPTTDSDLPTWSKNADSRHATIQVHDPKSYQMAVLGGGLGAAEAYIRGYWDTPNLVEVMRALSHHATVMAGMERGLVKLRNPINVFANWFRRNSKAGSRRNISAHYDLSNEFFELMLDPTMTYSSGIFAAPGMSLQQASEEKYDRICRHLQLKAGDRVLEIGCGWGGFAIYAATKYHCHVTAVTISKEQHNHFRQRIKRLQLEDRITLELRDYRDLRGKFDKLVSIEMIEAVGERFLPQFFRQCSDLLKEDGMMMLQAITIPDDRFVTYRRSVDFIRRYVFPGGFLPSFSAMGQSIRSATNFRIADYTDFGLHYGETLKRWRERFWAQIDQVRALGFDQRFERTWNYYLCYCEAGFRERQIGVAQILLLKPQCESPQAGIPYCD